MGIVTAATLRLEPAVAERRVLWAGLPSLPAARQLLRQCQDAAGAQLEGFEVLPQSCLDAVLGYLPAAREPLTGPHVWHALIELVADASAAPHLNDLAESVLTTAFAQGLIEDAVIAANEAQADAFWLLRDSIAPAERGQGPAMQHDISVPVERMADFVDVAVPAIEAAFPGTRAIAFGHLGDGNVHFHVLAPPGVDGPAWQATTGAAISAQVFDLVTAWHGSISAEHGIGKVKLRELERLSDPVTLALMRQIKAALDPAQILNPGKLVSLASTPALAPAAPLAPVPPTA